MRIAPGVSRVLGQGLGIAVAALAIAAALAFLGDRLLGAWMPPPEFMEGGSVGGGPPWSDNAIGLRDFTYTCSINSLGIRDAEVPPAKAHACRIVALGDSYTFGWGVELEQAWVKRLEYYLRQDGLDVEVINCGRPGSGPLEYWQLGEFIIPKLKPDLVVIGLLQGNDLNQSELGYLPVLFPNIIEWQRRRALQPQPPPQSSGPRSQQPLDSYRRWMVSVARDEYDKLTPEGRAGFERLDVEVKELFFKGMLNPWMIASAADGGDQFTAVCDADSRDTRRKTWGMGIMLRRINQSAARFGGRAVALSVPNGVYDNRPLFERLKRLGHNMNPGILMSNGPDVAAQRAAERAGIPFHEVSQVFRDHVDDPALYFEMDHHFAAAGHDLFAKSIAPLVAEDVRAALGRK